MFTNPCQSSGKVEQLLIMQCAAERVFAQGHTDELVFIKLRHFTEEAACEGYGIGWDPSAGSLLSEHGARLLAS